MLVDLFDSEAIKIQVIEAGVGELDVEAAKLGQIEWIVLTVVG